MASHRIQCCNIVHSDSFHILPAKLPCQWGRQPLFETLDLRSDLRYPAYHTLDLEIPHLGLLSVKVTIKF